MECKKTERTKEHAVWRLLLQLRQAPGQDSVREPTAFRERSNVHFAQRHIAPRHYYT